MFEWLTQTITSMGLTWHQVLLGLVLSVITFAASIAAVSWVVVRLPANYFHSSHARDFLVDRHRALRWVAVIAKNLFGGFLVLLGIVMSLPGVPGQGILTILLGVMLLDFPGKRRLEQRLVGRPQVLRTINRLRGKFDKPPLILD
jgi:hypothetical protein